MNKRFTLAILFCGVLSLSTWAQATIQPNAKTEAAMALGYVTPSSDEEMIAMNTKADKMCWVEEIKGTVNPENAFVLMTKTGEEVILTLAQLLSINPLLYELPQQADRCENLIVQTSDGSYHMLVVRSEKMMQNEIKRATIQSK